MCSTLLCALCMLCPQDLRESGCVGRKMGWGVKLLSRGAPRFRVPVHLQVRLPACLPACLQWRGAAQAVRERGGVGICCLWRKRALPSHHGHPSLSPAHPIHSPWRPYLLWPHVSRLQVSQVSDVAKAAVEAAGGSVTTVYYNQLGLRALIRPDWFAAKGRLLPRAARPPPKLEGSFDRVGELPPSTQVPQQQAATA